MTNPTAVFEFGDFALDVSQQTLTRRGSEPAILNGKPFDVLVYLVEHAGQALDKEALLEAIWPGVVVEENSLTQVISTLRQLLGETRSENRYILTLPRKGYRFVAPVSLRSAQPLLANSPSESIPVSINDATRSPKRRLWIGTAVLAIVVAASGAVYFISRPSTEPALKQVRTLAILPFKPLLASDRNESLEIGMADSLIANLSRRGDQTVRPLSSVRRFASVDQDAIAAGRDLQADAVLDGSIQRQGDRLRVTVRLLRVADGKQLWSQTFDQKFTDIFAVQDSITLGIAKELPQWQITESDLHRYTHNAEAYANFASGEYLRARSTVPTSVQAIAFFEKAIALDPNYAAAYAGIASSYMQMGIYAGLAPHEVFPRALQAVEKALALDPTLAPAYAVMGQIKVQYYNDWVGAERDFAHAIKLDPNYAPTYLNRGMFYAGNGQPEAALANFQQAGLLEPFNLGPRVLTGNVLIYMGRYDEAITKLREVLATDDRADGARGFLIRALILKGEYQQALNEMPDRQMLVPLGYSYRGQALALMGRRAEAQAEVSRLLELGKQQFVPSMDVAIIYAALHDNDRAFAALDRAIEERSTHIAFVAQSPMLASLRTDPRFDALVKRIGIYGRKLPE